MNIKIRLTLLNFLEFAVWGAYLISMGLYLGSEGLGSNIGWFYSVQGFVSLCMPALMGIVAAAQDNKFTIPLIGDKFIIVK